MAEPFGRKLRRFYRQNEKAFWVVLLLLLAPAFGFTGIMQFVLTRPGREKIAEVYGTSYTVDDVRSVMNRIEMAPPELRLLLNALDEQDRGMEVGVRDALMYIMYEEEARRLGIMGSRRDLADMLVNLYKGMVAQRRLAGRSFPDQRARQAAWQMELENVRWNPEDYRALIERRYGGSVNDFEARIASFRLIYKLYREVASTVVVSEKEVYDEFLKSEEERVVEILQVPAEAELEACLEKAKALSDDELRTYFGEHGGDFTHPDQIRFEYLKLPFAYFKDEVEVTEEEIREYYERNVREFALGPLEFTEDPGFAPRGKDAAEELRARSMRPLDEVREEITRRVTERKLMTAAQAFAAKIDAEVNWTKTAASGKDVLPYPELGEKYPELIYGETGFRSEEEFKDLPDVYNEALIRRWFRNLEEGKDIVGKISSCRYPNSARDDFFFFRNVAGREAGPLGFEEAREMVRRAMARADARKAVKEKVDGILAALRDGKKEIGELAKEEGYTVLTSGPTKSTGPLMVPKASGEVDENTGDPLRETHAMSEEILDEAFRAKAEGEVVDPVEDARNDLWCIVRVMEIRAPEPGRFEDVKLGLRYRVLGRKREAYVADWRRRLIERANPQLVRIR